MNYGWKRTLFRYYRLINRTLPQAKIAFCLSGNEKEILDHVSQIDIVFKEKIDVWLSPVYSDLKTVIKNQMMVRKVFLCPVDQPMSELKSGDVQFIRVYGRYERIVTCSDLENHIQDEISIRSVE